MAAPPGSTRLRIGEDVTWSDVGGVYERDDSLKENTNPKCLLKNVHHHGGSQRVSGNLKPTAAPIIGLSGKLGGGGRRNHHSHQHHQQHPPAMFPRKAKTGGGGREARQGVPEPGSPQVSCIGKVLSERERARRRSHHRPPPPEMEETTSRGGGGGGGGGGCCPGFGGFMGLRRSRSRKSAVDSVVDWSPPPPPRREAKPAIDVLEQDPPAPAPGLGGVMRFASGRRAAGWAAAGADEDDRVAKSGPL
ncbi:uncharacterized protein LOC100845425 [Brachypodium distachyon]|uniref:Uncharacterized protein n=1 Tax=Brachypodium distachyon TaxID=15368 RepID=I1INH5_BRADI|nr:uncharacterized protein LOC100845425 [Brachypodium distachyon]KQJ89421.1 hypothetical protein BRADI_4g25560v3 [Brachypodium distachyon]|eukprot:XP_003576317.1 uncharacterized protein LOC100845425 [Brachypodium distachyon]